MGPVPLTYMGWLSATAGHDPDRVALVDPTVTVTYGELMALARAGGCWVGGCDVVRGAGRPGVRAVGGYLVLFLEAGAVRWPGPRLGPGERFGHRSDVVLDRSDGPIRDVMRSR